MRDIAFPSSIGHIVRALRDGFAAANEEVGWVAPKLPTKYGKPLEVRMVTVRDDGGPEEGPVTRRRHAINIYAEDAPTAERIAQVAMVILRKLPTTKQFKNTDQFSGPFEVDDDPVMQVDQVELAHTFFPFRLTILGQEATAWLDEVQESLSD